MRTQLKVPWMLSTVTAVLMAAQASVGLLRRDVYRDIEWIKLTWLGNDIVTLVLAVPLLAWALWAVRRGSKRAELLWYGVLAYTAYNYQFYAHGTRLNELFPLYVALTVLPTIALLMSLGRADVSELSGAFTSKTPARSIGTYMVFVGLGLAAAWLAIWAGYAFGGVEPTVGEGPYKLVATLDFSFVIPFMVLGGILLMRRRPWGYALGVIMNVKGVLYTAVLSLNSYIGFANGIEGSIEQLPFWGALTIGSAAALTVMLANAAGDEREPAIAPAPRGA